MSFSYISLSMTNTKENFELEKVLTMRLGEKMLVAGR